MKKKGCKCCKLFKVLFGVLLSAGGLLFTVYMLNLDMKLVGWLYVVLNKFHDLKPRDVQF
ncbi:MAG: hypothetical protein RR055_00795 [Oscillospiraceae bacterium]